MPHIIKGKKLPKPEPSNSQGYCGVCGRVHQQDSEEPCLLLTVIHADGNPLSCCARCWKWWKIKDGTRVKRLDA